MAWCDRKGSMIVRAAVGSCGMWLVAVGVSHAAGGVVGDPEIARGIVFEDLNGNGLREPGEPGVAAVRVSDGHEVVLTDETGRYELGIEPGDIVHVVKPRGYMTRVDGLNMPRFYYIHKPEGSPAGLRYQGVDPTGPMPESIDFPLTRVDEPDRFSVWVLADPQPYSREQIAFFERDTITEIRARQRVEPAAFGVSLGDLVGDDLDLFEPLNEAQGSVGVPWYNVYGNHDMNFRSPDDEHAAETFHRVYGPTDYAFQYGRAHFIALDNVYWKGYTENEDGRVRTDNYEGRLLDRQIEFVRNYVSTLSPDELVVVLMHIPMLSDAQQHSVPQRGALLEALSGHPNTLSLSGHTHVQMLRYFGQGDGHGAGAEHLHANLVTASGSWFRGALDEVGIPETTMRDGAPNGYTVLTVDGNEFSLRFKASRRPASHQMNIHLPSRIGAEAVAGVEVVANVFGGSSRSVVRMRVLDTQGRAVHGWSEMGRDARIDPFYAELKEIEQSDRPPTGRSLPNPIASSHIWVGALPGALEPGFFTVEVETIDAFGQRFVDSRGLWVE